MNHQYTILSGLMTHGRDCWNEHGGNLSADMFDGDLQKVFQAIEDLFEADRLVDPVAVIEKLGQGWEQLVTRIAREFSSLGAFGAYVKELQISSTETRAKEIGAQLMDSGDYDAARKALETLGDTSARSGTVDGQTALTRLWDDVQAKADHDTIGLATGLLELDRKLGGLMEGDLVLIAGRPSHGKTALMLNICQNVACPVGIFSLEMPTAKLMGRLISSQGIDHGKLKHPKSFSQADWDLMVKASGKIKKDLQINDLGGISIGAIETEARRMVRQHGVGLICIDYVQLVTCKAENRLEVVSEISRRLKALAKNLEVPVIALSQMNRKIEGAFNPVYSPSMLRESGQLEQDADVIIFVDRPEQRIEGERPGEADLIIGKNRDGEIGTVAVAWQGRYQRFVNLQRDWYERSGT